MAALTTITLAAPGTSASFPLDGNMSSPLYTIQITAVAGGGSIAIQGSIESDNPTFATLSGMSAITSAGIYTFSGGLRWIRVVLTGGTSCTVKILTPGIGS